MRKKIKEIKLYLTLWYYTRKDMIKRFWEKIKRKFYEKIIKWVDYLIRKLDSWIDKIDDKLLLIVNRCWVK